MNQQKFIQSLHYGKYDIRRIRRAQHMTQEELAQYLDVTKKTVEAWEYGKNPIPGPAARLLYLLETGNSGFLMEKSHYLDGLSYYSTALNSRVFWTYENEQLYLRFTKNGKAHRLKINRTLCNNPNRFALHCGAAEIFLTRQKESEAAKTLIKEAESRYYAGTLHSDARE